MHNGSRRNLLIDADDTLWENNIYFERVIAQVQSMLEPCGVSADEFRLRLNQRERENIPVYGYGTVNFTRSLVGTFQRFFGSDGKSDLVGKVESLSMGIMNHPLEILEGVQETLAYLCSRHSLYLVTKGDPEEQIRKIAASGLRRFFVEVEVLPEKNARVYRALLARLALDPDQTWMIGNSPRSDVNPAILAGMNAIFIPHPHTWILEHEEPLRHQRLIEVKRFSDLRSLF